MQALPCQAPNAAPYHLSQLADSRTEALNFDTEHHDLYSAMRYMQPAGFLHISVNIVDLRY